MNELRHVGIYVSDLAAMEDFYTAVFSMKAVCSGVPDANEVLDGLFGRKDVRIRVSKLVTPCGAVRGSGDMIELIKVEDRAEEALPMDRPIFLPGTCHVAFGVDDIFEVTRLLTEHGGTMVTEIRRMENGNYLAFARDIEGNWLELIQRGN